VGENHNKYDKEVNTLVQSNLDVLIWVTSALYSHSDYGDYWTGSQVAFMASILIIMLSARKYSISLYTFNNFLVFSCGKLIWYYNGYIIVFMCSDIIHRWLGLGEPLHQFLDIPSVATTIIEMLISVAVNGYVAACVIISDSKATLLMYPHMFVWDTDSLSSTYSCAHFMRCRLTVTCVTRTCQPTIDKRD